MIAVLNIRPSFEMRSVDEGAALKESSLNR